MKMEKNNLTTKNINEFTTGDTIYIPRKEKDNIVFFLCEFIEIYGNQIVHGKAVKAMTNPVLYEYEIEQGLILKADKTKCAVYGKGAADRHSRYHYCDATGYFYRDVEEESNVNITTHPSFGLIRASRRSSSGNRVLFGSSIKNNNIVAIEIHEAEHDRDLSNDWYHDKKSIIEIEMSPSQFSNEYGFWNTLHYPVS